MEAVQRKRSYVKKKRNPIIRFLKINVYNIIAYSLITVMCIFAVMSVINWMTPVKYIGTEISYIRKGSNLWEVASEIKAKTKKNVDVRQIIDDIKKLNGFDTAIVQPGGIVVPIYDKGFED